jgi:molecular chaperone GrpE
MSAEKHTEKARSEIEEAIKAPDGKAADAKTTDGKAEDAKAVEKKGGRDETLNELTSLLQHLQADFENYKKRTEKEQQNNVMLGKALIIRRILPVLDTFDHALKEHKGDTEGLGRIHSQLISALEAEGLRPIKAIGEKLDPYRHECLQEECSEHGKGIVLEEIQKGYMLNDFVIRHSLVKVSSGKKPEPKAAKDEKEGEK